MKFFFTENSHCKVSNGNIYLPTTILYNVQNIQYICRYCTVPGVEWGAGPIVEVDVEPVHPPIVGIHRHIPVQILTTRPGTSCAESTTKNNNNNNNINNNNKIMLVQYVL